MFLKKIFCLILISLIPIDALAQDTVWIDQNKPAPFSGYLLPPDKAKEQRNIGLERDSLKLTNTSLNNTITYDDNIITDITNQNKELQSDKKDLAEQLGKQSSSNDLQKIVYFGLGVLATSMAVMAAKQLTK